MKKINENTNEIPIIVNTTVKQYFSNFQVIKLGLYDNLDDMLSKVDKQLTGFDRTIDSFGNKVNDNNLQLSNIVKENKADIMGLKGEIKNSRDKVI